LFPDAWFAAIVGVVGGPFVVVHKFLGRCWSKVTGIFKKAPRQDEESNSGAPAVVVSEVVRDDVADMEKGRLQWSYGPVTIKMQVSIAGMKKSDRLPRTFPLLDIRRCHL